MTDVAKYRQWHEEARQEAADLRAENAALNAALSEAEEDAEHRLEALWACLMKRAKFEAEVRQEAADLRLMRERDRLAGIVEQVRAAIEGDGGES